MIELAAKSVLAYLIGSLMGGVVVGALRGGVDLRKLGSGNVGATNALRTQGKAFALAVLLIDAGKGVLAVTLLPAWTWPWAEGTLPSRETLAYVCGAAVALGHIYPVWYGFHGGKGVATLMGVYGALLPAAFPWMAATFVLITMLSGFVALSSIGGALCAVVFIAVTTGLLTVAGGFTLAMAALVIFKHRENLRRIVSGEEYRFERARALGRFLHIP